MKAFRTFLFLVLTLLGAACGGSASSPPRAPDKKATEVDLAQGESPNGGAESRAVSTRWVRPSVGGPTSKEIPIDAGDATWGSAVAPVTIVVFSDFQCPFCSRAHPTLQQLMQTYGAQKLRVVFKHNPLPFHQDAMPAALAAQAVYEAAGPDAFFAYADLLFRGQQALTDANLLQWAADVGVDRSTLLRAASSAEVRGKIQSDIALAQSLGLRGTPSFMINGARLVGAQPYEEFKTSIDAELAQAAALSGQGVAAADIYARRVAENYRPEPEDEPSGGGARPEPPDTTVWKVPVGKSPVTGPANALVTLVEFSDFQCPYCKRAQSTVEELIKRYPGKLRVVFKNQPLSFHQRALPAALFAMEARAQKGDKGFWEAAKLLFADQGALEDEDLVALGARMKLNPARVKAALGKQTHKPAIEADQDLAEDVGAEGTPTFYINGRRLSGAQPIEKFVTLIDTQLDQARALVQAGTQPAQVYGALIKDGKAGKPLELATATPSVSKDNPSRGSAKAPVTIQIFSDFQCPFCKRVLPTLEKLEKQYPGRLRIVWRNLPLPFHSDARPAAIAAMEAFAQKGNAGFWKMHELIYADQENGVDRQALEAHAKKAGLALDKLRSALDSGAHERLIQADEAAAKAAGISGTPGFVINGYHVSGAQPLSTFKKVVERALEDARLGRKPAP